MKTAKPRSPTYYDLVLAAKGQPTTIITAITKKDLKTAVARFVDSSMPSAPLAINISINQHAHLIKKHLRAK